MFNPDYICFQKSLKMVKKEESQVVFFCLTNVPGIILFPQKTPLLK